ncbi:hypothetical protein [Streptomyces albireticuli]|uniref:Uncharacterized protein n=1 Tax=Streptomyces albireticuli TaxID=1940 RepID=A0A2A2DEM1_9ACTN|nr:hypothetical protein [Streptomyces albireticuli]MCD9143394.1 hypothetical protein [Streptomyces albireticuli]MCD9164753.1 hypothetical protein [Streptomyces albireticuli]MCD9191511.1 hypothetical protein [Streptomyces albireticuli]PAU49839.1 hypothetical protein CK936_05685 [Streptomyces albireticuli]
MTTRARISLASVAAAALVLTAAADASADPTWEVSGAAPTQRGREAAFTVTITPGTLDENNGYVTLESPAFAKKVTLKAKRFREGKDGVLYAHGAGMVLCDVTPGTYPVALKDQGEGEAVDTVDLTVVPEMDPGNRDFCAGPKSYEDAVDKTSEAALEDEEEEGDGMSTGAVVGVAAGSAVVAAVLTALGTYALVRRAKKGADRSW